MNRIIKLLPGMKFMSGGVLYKPGDILPDSEDARDLVRKKKAEYVEGEDEAAAGEGDGYEKMTVKDLTNLVNERGIELPKGANKGQIIELLRAWDKEYAGDS